MKKDYTDEQYKIADNLMHSALRRDYAVDSMIKGFFRPRKVSNPQAEKTIKQESEEIVSKLDGMTTEERFEIFDCINKLGHYHSTMSMLDNLEKGTILNHHTFMLRSAYSVYEIYYDSKVNGYLDTLEIVQNNSEDLKKGKLDIKSSFNNLDERDKNAIVNRLKARMTEAQATVEKPNNFEEFKKANNDIKLFSILENIIKREKEEEQER